MVGEPSPIGEDDEIALDATKLQPMDRATELWRVVEGERAGASIVRERAPTDRFGATVADLWRRDGVDEQTYLLATAPDGAVSMPANLSHHDRAISRFEPALLMAPAVLRPLKHGESSKVQVHMTVRDEDRPEKVTQEGTATREMKILDRVPIATPLGVFDAVRVSVEFRAKLTMATASEVAILYVVPELGVVAEQRREEIRAVGIFTRITKQTIVRLPAPAP
ncbi:MAG: hypothetical protein U0575_13645 [Phycisphaerales bacterium]